MYLENISLTNFKNYETAEFVFSPGINCLTGNNGSGKTNVLDAIHFTCLTKSVFQKKDNILLYPDSDYYLIKASFLNDDSKSTVQASFQKRKKKVFKLKNRAYDKLSEHIGKFPVVMITPYDTDLIREGSEMRRKFFDGILCQSNQQYLQELLRYNHILKTRNSLLKQFYEQRYFDSDLLETYNAQLFPLNKFISQKRAEFISKFTSYFTEHYNFLCPATNEEVSLNYKTNITTDLKQSFIENQEKDKFLQRTSIGIHKDDFSFKLNNQSVKQMGSQGQQKSFILALQLAKFSILQEIKQTKPLLLLDDIFDKLDEDRISRLIELMTNNEFGQVFITDASTQRVRNFIKNINTKIRLITIEGGAIKEFEDV